MTTTLALSHLRLHLVPERPLQLPAHNKGNSLRGGFGAAFRRLVCIDMSWECAQCSLRYSCPYTTVFNPFIPPDAPQFSGNQNIPRPFIFKPPLSTQTQYAAGEAVVFDLVVAGKAIDYLPYFIISFRELGAGGFGLNRAHVRLTRVDAIDAHGDMTAVYEASTNVVRPAPPLLMDVGEKREERASRASARAVGSPSEKDVSAHPEAREGCVSRESTSPGETAAEIQITATDLTLDFLTPTTLKAGSGVGRDGTIVRQPAFHHIVKRLRDRVNALATFYGGGPLDLDFKALGDAADRIETVDDRTHWVERARFSRRRDVTHDLSGFVGRISFRGDVAPFLSLLRIGAYVHVGKNAVFGNGGVVLDGESRALTLPSPTLK